MSQSRCLLLALAALLCVYSAAQAQSQSAYAPPIQPATYNSATTAASSPAPAGQSATFNRRAPLVGDQLEQDLSISLQLGTMIRQNNQILEQAKTSLRRHQRRIVTTTHVAGGVTKAVLVRYAEAGKEIGNGPANSPFGEIKATSQPVHGKTYRVRRDGEALLINNEAGEIPPLVEYEIVSLNMESLGRPNPLADYLAGQTFTVGQKITLPNAVAEKLLGLGEDMGSVSRFDLTLKQVNNSRGVPCAEFLASIEAGSNDSSQMKLSVEGPLVIEVDTCRAVEANFTGPIGMSETRGSLTTTYHMIGTGNMTVRIASDYADAKR